MAPPKKPQSSRKLRCKGKRFPCRGQSKNGDFGWDMRLKFRAYSPRELLNYTVVLFIQDDSHLTGQQLAARSEFVELYLRHQHSKREPPRSLMARFLDLASRFFFFDLLKLGSAVELHVGGSVAPSSRDALAYCQVEGDRASITLGTRRRGKAAATGDCVGTLLHEMCHAYLRLFSCQCAVCRRNEANTLGLGGHGPVWRHLFAAACRTVRSWHPDLAGLDLSRPHDGDLPLTEWRHEHRALAGAPETTVVDGTRHRMNAVRRESSRQVVYMDANNELRVKPRFVRHGQRIFSLEFGRVPRPRAAAAGSPAAADSAGDTVMDGTAVGSADRGAAATDGY